MATDARLGTQVAGYRLERLLGKGGMGAVYLAEDERLGRKVALKVLPPELAENERFRTRFLRESRLAASLDHPNVIPVYEAGEADGLLYIAMRYVEGEDLRQRLQREGRLDPAEALRLLAQVAGALDAAHERGLVHRDVKPANVLVDRGGHAYLADFGLTKQSSSISGLTATGQLMGTVDYVPPEQVKGQAVDRRSDVYSLACVLYESLAGEPPFARENEVAVLWAHVEDELVPLSDKRPELPEELDAVLARGLAKEPGERYLSAGELVLAARDALGLDAQAAPLRLPRRRGLLRTRRGQLALALVAVLVAGAALAGVLALRSEDAIAVPPNSLAVIDPAENRVVAAIPVGRDPGPVTVGFGSVWVVNRGDLTVERYDAQTYEKEATVPLNKLGDSIAAGAGAVWVASPLAGTLDRIDPRSNRVVRAIDVRPSQFGNVAVGDGAVWAAFGDRGGSEVLKIDPRENAIVDRGPAGGGPAAIAYEPETNAVWVAHLHATPDSLFRFTAAALGEGAVDRETIGADPSAIAASARNVWVAARATSSVDRIALSGIPRTVRVPAGPAGLAFDRRSLWVVSDVVPVMSRLDPERMTVTASIAFDHRPVAVAVGENRAWVTVVAR